MKEYDRKSFITYSNQLFGYVRNSARKSLLRISTRRSSKSGRKSESDSSSDLTPRLSTLELNNLKSNFEKYQESYKNLFDLETEYHEILDIYNNMDINGNRDGKISRNEIWVAVKQVGRIKQVNRKDKFTRSNFDNVFSNLLDVKKRTECGTSSSEDFTLSVDFDMFLQICSLVSIAVEKEIPDYEDYKFLVESEEQFKIIYAAFAEMDTNGDHKIDAKELKTLLANNKIKLKTTIDSKNTDEIQKMIQKVDKNFDGFLQFSEFVEFLNLPRNPDYMFALYDKDRDGFIDYNEMKECAFDLLGKELDEDILKIIIELYDENKDGKICYEEFLSFLEKTSD